MSKATERERLPRRFFSRATLEVARDLLGKRLVRVENGERLSGLITETEAYIGTEDLGCHARAGRTPRNHVMWGPPGFAYVYFTYGMHWMLNFVTEQDNFPAAVLIRAIQPTEGKETIAARRPDVPETARTNGPAKLTRALNIDRSFDGLDLCRSQKLFVEDAPDLPDGLVLRGPRIGLNTVPEPWKSMDWRFRVQASSIPPELC